MREPLSRNVSLDLFWREVIQINSSICNENTVELRKYYKDFLTGMSLAKLECSAKV